MDCCNKENQKIKINERNKKGFLSGLIYGLIPHIGCIGFIIFSIFGVTSAVSIFKPFLLNRYFFYFLIIISFVFATISALIYLKKNKILSFLGIKKKKGYLLTLYGTTVGINLILFIFIFPIITNVDAGVSFTSAMSNTFFSQPMIGENILTIKVDIPCSGHAPLITGRIKEIDGVKDVLYRFPDLFDINFDSKKTSQEEILFLEIFNTYQAKVILKNS